jgi:hypothetical protein
MALDVMALDVMALDVMALDVMALDVMALDVMALDVMALAVIALAVIALAVIALAVIALAVIALASRLAFAGDEMTATPTAAIQPKTKYFVRIFFSLICSCWLDLCTHRKIPFSERRMKASSSR